MQYAALLRDRAKRRKGRLTIWSGALFSSSSSGFAVFEIKLFTIIDKNKRYAILHLISTLMTRVLIHRAVLKAVQLGKRAASHSFCQKKGDFRQEIAAMNRRVETPVRNFRSSGRHCRKEECI